MSLLIPITIGLSVVLQGILNRKMSLVWGLPEVIVLNGAVFFIISLAYYFGVRLFSPEMPPLKSPEYWYFLPGICGFLIVLGVPSSIGIMGPTKTFITLIVSQVVFSLALEKVIFGDSPGTLKIVGAAIATIGAVLVAIS